MSVEWTPSASGNVRTFWVPFETFCISGETHSTVNALQSQSSLEQRLSRALSFASQKTQRAPMTAVQAQQDWVAELVQI